MKTNFSALSEHWLREISLFLMLYFLFAFAHADTNVSHWSWITRLALLAIWFLVPTNGKR